jgi:glycosyltransferase involved in cell wall biosynthesis
MSVSKRPKLLSIVLPVYNEAGNIKTLHRALSKLATSLRGYRFEFIFVNDGSSDNSGELLAEIARLDSRVVVLNFSRNFGQQLAITAGVDYAKGAAVITMDSDLQDPPTVCRDMVRAWQDGFDIVYAHRRSRHGDSIFKRASASGFYWLINQLSDVSIPQNVGDFRLLDRQVVNELMKFKEHARFFRSLVSYVGFRATTIEFDRPSRHRGETAYTISRMLRLASDGIIGTSTAPLRFVAALGWVTATSSAVVAVILVAMHVVSGFSVPSWVFITSSVFFVGGVQAILLGILGSYTARIYTEAQDRPLYIVASVIKSSSKKP